MNMEAFNDEMARQEYIDWASQLRDTAEPWDIWLAAWHCLRDKFATKTFVPREPVVVHGPLPDNLPIFPHIIPERKESPTPKRYWCCSADFGEHEPTCHNYKAEIEHNDH